MNLSFGTDSAQAYTLDPLAYAAEQAWKHGIVVVTSAGNAGDAGGLLPTRRATRSCSPSVPTIPTDPVTTTTASPPFSSTGDGSRNPDLVAPGVHVQSLRDPGQLHRRQIGVERRDQLALLPRVGHEPGCGDRQRRGRADVAACGRR